MSPVALTSAADGSPAVAAADGSVDAEAAQGGSSGFHVRLDNFNGPFDLLLQLISQHRMDVTEVALHTVTDEFIAHLRNVGDDVDLGMVTEFLVIAATLLDLKAARLLPDAEVDDPSDVAVLEAKDLLFARLLAYRAYQQAATLFSELQNTALHRYPRAVTLESRYLGLLPEVRIGIGPVAFAALAAGIFTPKPVPFVSLDHLHSPRVSVAEHTRALRHLLSDRGIATFGELTADCGQVMEIVARFLGLLDLYRESAVTFDQPEPLGPLTVRWTGSSEDSVAAFVDEEYE